MFQFLVTPSYLQNIPNYKRTPSHSQLPIYQQFPNPIDYPNNNRDRLPFECPNQPPWKPTQPPYLGYFSNDTLDEASNAEYSQFLAALALKPCDEDVIRVFTNQQYNGEHSVALIFTDKESKRELEQWLRYAKKRFNVSVITILKHIEVAINIVSHILIVPNI